MDLNYDSQIIKSPNDHRIYKYITLKNGLKILLISDVKSPIISVSLTVGAGSYNEGNTYGLAHFLEHMLFLGNEKFKKEDAFQLFVNKNGGMCNAYTSGDHTCYFYTIRPSLFNKSLEMFGHMFINPLLTMSSIKKEINSVDSEHHKNLLSDDWRALQVLKKACNTNNPFSNFSTGNFETLNIPNIRNKLLNFFDTYYIPSNMRLVILGNEDIESIEFITTKIFQNLSNNNTLFINKLETNFPKPFNNYKLLVSNSVKSFNKMIMYWQIPFCKEYYNIKPFTVLSYIFGNEGPDSLINSLKNDNYINYANINEVDIVGEYKIYSFEIDLTNKGLANTLFIYNYISKYINLIIDSIYMKLDIIKDIYGEIQFTKKQEFMFLEISDLNSYTNSLAVDWIREDIPISYLLSHQYIFPDFNMNVQYALHSFIKNFNNNNLIILIQSNTFNDILNYTDKWYGVKYNIYNNLDKLTSTNINIYLTDKLNKQIRLPRKNPFICYNPVLIKSNEHIDEPIIIHKKKGFSIFWKYDTNYHIPIVFMNVAIKLPNVIVSAKMYLEFIILIAYTKYVINPYLYECGIANYETNIHLIRDTLQLYIYGCSDNIDKIINLYINALLHLKIDKNIFTKIKNQVYDELSNENMTEPYLRINQIIKKYMEKYYYSNDELLKEINNIDYMFHQNLINNIFSKTSVLCYFQGNIDKNFAKKIGCIFNKIILSPYEIDIQNNKIINIAQNKFLIDYSNSLDNKNSLLIYCCNIDYVRPGLTHEWEKTIILLNILDICISQDFYNELRTQQQLGYIVKSSINKIGDRTIPFYQYCFIIQSNHKNINQLNLSVEKFLSDYKLKIDNMDNTDFEEFKISLTEIYEKNNYTLKSCAAQNFEAIYSMDCIFNKKKYILNIIPHVTLFDFKNFYCKYIYGSNNTNHNIFGTTSSHQKN